MKLFLFKPPILRGTFPHMIMRSPRPAVDIWHKVVNFFSLKSFLKCQAQILVHFVIEGQIVSPFITPASSYSHVWFHCLPRNLR